MGFLPAFSVTGSSTILVSSQNPSTFGQTVTFTATVSPSSATGLVQFNDTSTNPPTLMGTSSISNGITTFSTSSLSIGNHNIVASYLGDVNTAPSTGTELVQTVSPAPLIAAGVNVSLVEGSSFQGIVAHFTDANPNAVPSDYTATINWGDGTTSNAAIVSNSNGGFDLTGTHTYAEEGSYLLHMTIVDNDGTTITTTSTATVTDAPLTANAININTVAGVSFQGIVAHFTDADPNAVPSDYTATINWGDGTTSNAAIVSNSNGGFDLTGTHTYATTGVRSLSITTSDSGGSSVTVTETITTSQMSSTTTVLSSQNPSTTGQLVTFAATVSPSTATGTVQFLSNGTNLGIPVVLSGGQASLTTSLLLAGTNNITASYSGDSVFGSSGGTLFQIVNKNVTTITLLSSNNPSTIGQSVTFTATISPSSATGIVTFMDGVTLLGTETISSGTSTFTTSSLSAGVHDISAIYLGDTNHTGSTSAVMVETVNQATASSTTTLLSSNATSIVSGHTITFTAIVLPNIANGTVVFQVNGTNLASNTLSNGQVTFTTSSLPAGFDNIIASYLGNNQFNASTSNSVGVTVITQGSSGVQTNATLSSATNLGQLVSTFVHARNDLTKELRQQTIDIIHACRAQAKSASPGDRQQIEQECKLQLQQVKQNFKDLQNQLKQEFDQLRIQFQSDIKQLHQQENTEGKNMTENFKSQISSLQGEIKQLHQQEGLEKKNMTENFNSQISFLQGNQNNVDTSSHAKVNDNKNTPEKNGPSSPKGKGHNKD
jgi:Bacterial Ig-like domain (group 3)